jgi:cytochrome c-type biogenesis protein CcmE
MTGRVAKGSWQHKGTVHTFAVEDRKGGGPTVKVRYVGQVPDPFREGREIVIDVRKQGATFEGQPDSLVTKCPSKFTAEPKT